MPTYIVTVHERWTSQIKVEAPNEKAARLRVVEGKGEVVDNSNEFIETLGWADDWTVEEES